MKIVEPDHPKHEAKLVRETRTGMLTTTADTPPSNIDPSPFSTPNHDEAIRVVAYLRAERRGFSLGHEVEDWLHARPFAKE